VHRVLIQSLYAVSLSLAARERLPVLDVEAALGALRESRRDVDRVIQDAREYLFDLRRREFARADLREGLTLLIDALRLNSGASSSLRVDPLVNDHLEGETRGHLLYVAREAVSNILRHAQATEASIDVVIYPSHVRLTVQDNGRGFDVHAQTDRAKHGLHTMALRARLVGAGLRSQALSRIVEAPAWNWTSREGQLTARRAPSIRPRRAARGRFADRRARGQSLPVVA
jgi:NarL family two-component system sensor histidine kinase LiaS